MSGKKDHLLFYCAGLALAPFVCIAAVMFLAATPWFLRHDGYPGMTQAGYELRLKHANCDVVIYGDSSALTGLDPEIVGKISGLKTCNISEGTTIQAVVGSDFPIASYLRNNKRPKFILMMFTSSIYIPYREPFSEYYPEGILYALQYARGPRLYRALARRPNWIAMFAIWAGHALINDLVKNRLTSHSSNNPELPKQERANRQGIWPYPLPAETNCTRKLFSPALVPRDEASVAAVRQRYGVAGTQVIVNVSPVPTCDVMTNVYEDRLHGLHDNNLERLPISFFNEGDVHFSPQGSRYISVEAGNQILLLIRSRAGAKG